MENFRQTLNASFPNLPKASKGTYLVDKPQLLKEGNLIDFEIANDALAWANNMLWEVHDLAKDEFLFRTKEQTDEWLDNVYEYVSFHLLCLISSTRLWIVSYCRIVVSAALTTLGF